MSPPHYNRNREQILTTITIIRGGTSRGFFFEGRNVPKPGEGLEEFPGRPRLRGAHVR